MNGKEKFMFIMLGALYIGAFYYYAMTEELNIRMDELNLADKQHVDKVLGSYADSLHTYNLRFIGRGKHLRKAQLDIIANTELIIKNTDSLLSLIDDVDFKLDNFIRETERSFKNVNNDIKDLSDEVRTNIRRTKQKLADLEQSRDQLSKDLKEVRALPSIIKGIQKMKEEAAKAAAEDD